MRNECGLVWDRGGGRDAGEWISEEWGEERVMESLHVWNIVEEERMKASVQEGIRQDKRTFSGW